MIISHVKIIAFHLSLFCKNYRFSKTVLYNKQKNTWILGNTRFISRVENSFAALTLEISCFILIRKHSNRFTSRRIDKLLLIITLLTFFLLIVELKNTYTNRNIINPTNMKTFNLGMTSLSSGVSQTFFIIGLKGVFLRLT